MPPLPPDATRPANDVRHLQRIFERRAAHFDDVAFLPREISQRMRERLDYIKINPAHVLDAGCGPGDDLPQLRERFSEALVCGVDLSWAMLARACRQDEPDTRWSRLLPNALGNLLGKRGSRLVQSDFSALPFAAGAFELIWSNLALHWHSRPNLIFAQWQRALKVNGLLMFSTFGPDTLKELRSVYAQLDASRDDGPRAHVIDFVDMHDLGDMLVENGFEIPVMDQERLTVTYQSPQSLLADVRRWGAYPWSRGAVGLMGRSQYRALLAALEARRGADGSIALTFEVIYGHAWKAVPRTTPEGHGIVRLDEIGRGPLKNR
ncbi:methyltransferase domain-containing protein [Paraburkholderia hayleyella]|uniref:methyltransferase domain-containing protein n=1 Tax=Paraburkholderia hayleyella TaxID=2152889 RepID=UPI0012929E3A|nr:methyltransferase domain-containing protein [Paraburkholderia hayleyella]